MLEKIHHVFNIGSTVTVKCSKVEAKNISWHNGSSGVKIKSGGRIELNGLSLKIKNLQLDDAGTYECRGESSTRFYTIYANGKLSSCSFCSSPQHYFYRDPYNAIFFFLYIKLCFHDILKYILYCYIILTKNLIILNICNGNRAEWTKIQGVIRRVICNYEHAYP